MSTLQKKTIIELRNMSKVYVTEDMETHAISGIDLTLVEGDYLAITGPSGSGKSTLLSILGLMDKASNGQYFLAGKDVNELSLDQLAELRNQEIGFIFQSFNLIDELTVLENVMLPMHYSPKVHSNIKESALKVLEKVDMKHRVNHFPSQLSGGQQQRVSIARALVMSPSILLIDEPTGNLDSHNGDLVMNMLQQLNDEGATLCMVTHDQRYANMARRKIELLDGRILGATEVMGLKAAV